MLIASGSDVKVVQARLRHASAKTTLDTYGHLWPDSDDSTRAAVAAVFVARADSLPTERGVQHELAGQRPVSHHHSESSWDSHRVGD